MSHGFWFAPFEDDQQALLTAVRVGIVGRQLAFADFDRLVAVRLRLVEPAQLEQAERDRFARGPAP